MKKIISVLLAVMMLAGVLSATVLTAGAGEAAKTYTVLFWHPDTEESVAARADIIKNHFSNIEGVTVIEKTTGALAEADLDGVQLVYILDCQVGSDDTEGANILAASDMLKNFVNAGGRIIMNGERPIFAHWGNEVLSTLAANIGGNFTITSTESGEDDMILNTEEKGELLDGLNASDLRPSAYSHITSTNPDAVWVAKDKDGLVFMLDQEVGNGYITVLTDIDWLNEGISDYYEYSNPRNTLIKNLFSNMLVDSAENIEAVEEAAATKYTVTLDSKNDTDAEALVIKEGEALPSVSVPVRKGYAFAGYFSQPDGKGDKYFNADGTPAVAVIGADVTLYALWKVESPATGDSAMGLWIVLMAVSAIGLAAVAVESRKRISK